MITVSVELPMNVEESALEPLVIYWVVLERTTVLVPAAVVVAIWLDVAVPGNIVLATQT